MLEGRGAIVDFSHVLSISDPVVRSVLESDLTERLGTAPYRSFRLTPNMLVLLFNRPTSRTVTDKLRVLTHGLETSHCGRIEWKIYDLQTEMKSFRADCRTAMDAGRIGGHDDPAFRPDSERLGSLLHIIDAMRTIDLASHMREQTAIRFDSGNNPVAEFQEMWVDLEDIERSIGVTFRHDSWRFAHVTEFLDFKVLDHATRMWSGERTISVNMHCANVLQPQFDELAARVASTSRSAMIFELSLSEYMDDPRAYLAAIAKLRDAGFGVAADSAVWPVLEKMSGHFPEVQYIKVPWTDAFGHLAPDQKERVKTLIASAPGAEFVLNRCGRPEDVEIGLGLGFSVFQGWGVPAPVPADRIGETV
jgi:EAL domain-containing protein (putative c-di-GMP-specific phosphodiesterase class I)